MTGDLLAHCIDTAIWLNGSINDVTAMTETFVKERMHTETGKMEPVGIDDACAFLCHFENGSLGLFESTRYARGHKALYTFEINGEHASIRWDLHDLHRLECFDHSDERKLRGWRFDSRDRQRDMPYMDKWWVPGLQIGYEHTFVHQVADFLKSHGNRRDDAPEFPRCAGNTEGLRCGARQRSEWKLEECIASRNDEPPRSQRGTRGRLSRTRPIGSPRCRRSRKVAHDDERDSLAVGPTVRS